MSITVLLDDQDITADLNRQHDLPGKISAGIYPDNSHNKWWDLWVCIQNNSTLKENYQDKSIHTLVIKDSEGGTYNAKIILRTKYAARNR